MLDQEKEPGVITGEDGLPVIPLDDAYRTRVAKRVEEMIGRPPLWYTATPEQLSNGLREWAGDVSRLWDQEGRERPHIPLEALRRENLYD